MEQGKLRKDDLQLDSDSELEGFEEWHGIDSDAEVDLSESGEDLEDNEGSDGEEDVTGDEEDEDDSGDDGEDDEVDLEESEADSAGDNSDSESGDEAEDEPDSGAELKKAEELATSAPAAPTGRYVPPHLRAAQLGEKAATDGAKVAERIKLERKAQGLLNK